MFPRRRHSNRHQQRRTAPCSRDAGDQPSLRPRAVRILRFVRDCVIDHRCLVPPTTPTNTREISKTPGLLHKSASPRATRLHHASDKSYYKSPAFPHTLARRAANGGGGGGLFYVVGGIDYARRGWAPRVSNSTVRRVCRQLLPVNDHSASS